MSHGQFLKLATLFEGSLVLIAYGLGWLGGGIDPWANLRFDWQGVVVGLLGTVPLYLVFVWSYGWSYEPMRQVKRLLVERMGPLLEGCRTHELVYLGLLAGVTEEALFRGVAQPMMESAMGPWWGLVGSNVLFALAHCATPLYAVLAGLTGMYLGWAMDLTGERNLLIPMLIHGCYDILAFKAVVNSYRQANGRVF
jgi:membrane protease YdiL (CAAX protease family)